MIGHTLMELFSCCQYQHGSGSDMAQLQAVMFTDHHVLQSSGLYMDVMRYDSIDVGKS